MPVLYVVGGGLFGSLAAAYARRKGVEAVVFDAALDGAASPAAAGLFKEAWAGKKLRQHCRPGLALLDRLYGVRHVSLTREDGRREALLFVPPAAVLEPNPVRSRVTAVGDGWLEAGGRRHEGWVYVAAGVWCEEFSPGLGVYGKAGAAFVFPGEREGQMRPVARGRQAVAFVRDPGTTYFSDGTAERAYTPDHDRQSLERAARLGLEGPTRRLWGRRPYTPGGPVFRKVGGRTWLATGGRKMGLVLGASFARRLIVDELGS
jgi:glycine/D-amino acid oxidase-like deaminating enzyme